MRTILSIMLCIAGSNLMAQNFDRVFVFLNKNPNKEAMTEEVEEELINQHLANMGILATEGKLINAGPFEGGGGIFVMNSNSIDTVQQWIQTDPAIRANRWIIEMYPFTTTVGGSCSLEPPYDMVTYQFARYKPSNLIANYKSGGAPENVANINDLINLLKEKEQLIMAGHFANNEGGILVLKDDTGIETIKSSSVVNSGTYTLSYKQLWIAKGSFCEK